jgi:hypothetical protein
MRTAEAETGINAEEPARYFLLRRPRSMQAPASRLERGYYSEPERRLANFALIKAWRTSTRFVPRVVN